MTTNYSKSTVERAKLLSDDLFVGHPEIIAARMVEQDALSVLTEVQRSIPKVDLHALRELISKMQAALQSETGRRAELALSDLLVGDMEFTRATAAARDGDHLARQLEAARMALRLYEQRAPEFGEPVRQAQRRHMDAQQATRRILDRLRLEHADRMRP